VIYEMRTYKCLPGGVRKLHELMEQLAIPIFKKVGMTFVGAWTPEVGGDENTLIYLLAYEDMGARQRAWDTFWEHPEWKAGRAKYAQEFGGPIVATSDSMFLKAAGYSPLK
jgi:hypothetical protein